MGRKFNKPRNKDWRIVDRKGQNKNFTNLEIFQLEFRESLQKNELQIRIEFRR